MRFFGLSLAAIIILSIPVYADYHYASHSGSNTYPYNSWETAADSIQKAVNATNPHDTVYVGSGNWVEMVAVQDFDSIGIVGLGVDSTFWTSTEQTAEVLTIDYGCLVSDIAFHDFTFITLGVRTYAGVIIKDCLFKRCHIGIQAAGGPTEITDCNFDSCGIAIDLPFGNGTYYIANNYIYGCNDYEAINLHGSSALAEKNIIINDPNNRLGICTICGVVGYAEVRNNVVANNYNGIGVKGAIYNNIALNFNLYYDAWGIRVVNRTPIYNNLMANCRAGLIVGDSARIAYNDFWQNRVAIENWGPGFDSVGNIFYDPMLVNPDSGDYHLQAYSPLIDAGDPNILDVDGTRSDIGAYGGPGGCSYIYLDLAPDIPDSLSGRRDSSSIILSWRYNYETDFNRYQVFKDTVSGFTPSIFNMIAEPETSYYIDGNINSATSYYYRLTAVDNQGNISEYSSELAMLPVGLNPFDNPLMPDEPVISEAYPNPFNSNVTIVYSASNLGPQPPEIKLLIYDIIGRVVRTLVDEHKPCGTYRVTWDGKDDNGENVSSGTYIARLYQWGMSGGDYPVKITLVK